MYLNPINATNQSFGCRGVTALDHFLIYWVGPLAAAFIATRLHTWMRNILSAAKKDMLGDDPNENEVRHASANGHTKKKVNSDERQQLSMGAEHNSTNGVKRKSNNTLLRKSLRNRDVYFAD